MEFECRYVKIISFRLKEVLKVCFYANFHIHKTIDCLRMDGKRGHMTCGNRLAIERQESFKKFASLEEELLLCLGLLGP